VIAYRDAKERGARDCSKFTSLGLVSCGADLCIQVVRVM
jgi:hypothetical protein